VLRTIGWLEATGSGRASGRSQTARTAISGLSNYEAIGGDGVVVHDFAPSPLASSRSPWLPDGMCNTSAWPAMSARGSHTQIILFGAGVVESQQTEAGAHSGRSGASCHDRPVTFCEEMSAPEQVCRAANQPSRPAPAESDKLRRRGLAESVNVPVSTPTSGCTLTSTGINQHGRPPGVISISVSRGGYVVGPDVVARLLEREQQRMTRREPKMGAIDQHLADSSRLAQP